MNINIKDNFQTKKSLKKAENCNLNFFCDRNDEKQAWIFKEQFLNF